MRKCEKAHKILVIFVRCIYRVLIFFFLCIHIVWILLCKTLHLLFIVIENKILIKILTEL